MPDNCCCLKLYQTAVLGSVIECLWDEITWHNPIDIQELSKTKEVNKEVNKWLGDFFLGQPSQTLKTSAQNVKPLPEISILHSLVYIIVVNWSVLLCVIYYFIVFRANNPTVFLAGSGLPWICTIWKSDD